MSGIHVVYLVLALIFATFLTYMFVYNIRTNNRQRAFKTKARPPIRHEAEIVGAATEKGDPGPTGTIS